METLHSRLEILTDHSPLNCDSPFVENVPPRGMEQLQAQDIMVKPVVTFREVARASQVFDVLKSVSHNGFPVVNKRGKLVGMILRNQILVLIKKKVFVDSIDGRVIVGGNGDGARGSRRKSAEDYEEGMFDYHTNLTPVSL